MQWEKQLRGIGANMLAQPGRDGERESGGERDSNLACELRWNGEVMSSSVSVINNTEHKTILAPNNTELTKLWTLWAKLTTLCVRVTRKNLEPNPSFLCILLLVIFLSALSEFFFRHFSHIFGPVLFIYTWPLTYLTLSQHKNQPNSRDEPILLGTLLVAACHLSQII